MSWESNSGCSGTRPPPRVGQGRVGLDRFFDKSAALIVAPFGGWLIDRFGDKRILVASLLLTAATSFASTRAGSFNTMLAIRIIEGVGYTGIVISGTTLMVRATDGARRAARCPFGVLRAARCRNLFALRNRSFFTTGLARRLLSALDPPARLDTHHSRASPIPQRVDGPSSAVEIRRVQRVSPS